MKTLKTKLQLALMLLVFVVNLSLSQAINLDSLKTVFDESPNAETGMLLLKRALALDPELSKQYLSKVNALLKTEDEFLDYRVFRGDLYNKNLKYDSAVKVYTDLLVDLKGSDKLSLYADLNDKIGIIYVQLREHQQALDYISEALAIREENELTSELPKSYYYYGAAQFRLGKHQEAANNFQKGILTVKDDTQKPLLANTYYMLANSLQILNSYDSALYYFGFAKELYDELELDQLKIGLNTEIAQVYILKQQFAEAKVILEDNLEDLKAFNDWGAYNRIYSLLTDVYAAEGNYRKALEYQKQKFDTVVSFLVSQRTESVAQITEDFRTDKQLDEAEEEAVSATQRAQMFGLIIVILAIVLIISYLLFTRAIQKKQLENLQAMVIGEENERKRVAKDLHDGIGVLLTGIKLRLSSFQDKVSAQSDFKDSLDQIDNACTEVRRISHNMVPASLTKLGLQEAILDLLDNVSASTDILIEETFDYEEGALAEEKEVLLYRIVQELVNNSLKYANPDKLELSISKSNNDYLLKYADNGKGFDKSKVKLGLGLKSIASRVNILKGKLSFDSDPSTGTAFNITIPQYG
ncbi:tetratricopeptide repeat-containing sensor histidine kinase [Roseivirga sp.]|uniref:tetratricopeptide repeat-containing sensor histidine kinase n=1 Tax=Roseivirga sp. TaxID=1964215 RepID=UPI003B8D9FD1